MSTFFLKWNILFVGVLGWGGEVAAYEVACQLPNKAQFEVVKNNFLEAQGMEWYGGIISTYSKVC